MDSEMDSEIVKRCQTFSFCAEKCAKNPNEVINQELMKISYEYLMQIATPDQVLESCIDEEDDCKSQKLYLKLMELELEYGRNPTEENRKTCLLANRFFREAYEADEGIEDF